MTLLLYVNSRVFSVAFLVGGGGGNYDGEYPACGSTRICIS